MVFKLKPLELSFDFEDREYDLGDTIDIHVDLSPNGEVDVREARVDLVCEERFSQHESGIVVGAGGSSWIQGGGKMRVTTDYVPSSSWVSQRTESYVHSSAAFLKDESLRSGHPSTYGAKLQIQPQPPTHLDEANDLQRDSKSSWTFKWTLVTSVNVVRGRDPKRQRKIKVKLPLAPVQERVGAKARMSRPKKRTGGSV